MTDYVNKQQMLREHISNVKHISLMLTAPQFQTF